MSEQKICPLLASVPLGAKPDCLGNRCAWAYEGGCALVSIARSLDGLNMVGVNVCRV
mgnify:CR=1 FL=1